MAEFVDEEQRQAYIAGLNVELASAHQHDDKEHEKAVLAELDRVQGDEEADPDETDVREERVRGEQAETRLRGRGKQTRSRADS